MCNQVQIYWKVIKQRGAWLAIILRVLSLSLCSHAANGQPPFHENELHSKLEDGYYVVVGAFKVKENAIRFNNYLVSNSHLSQYGFASDREIFYVYLGYYTNRDSAVDEAVKVRSNTKFSDSWVRCIGHSISKNINDPTILKSAYDSIVQTDNDKLIDEYDERVTYDSPSGIVQYSEINFANTEAFLSLYNATNGRVIEGAVAVVNTEKAKLIKEVQGNQYLYLPDPKSQSGQLTLSCNVFGYRKVQHELNFKNPLVDSSGVIELMGTTLLIKFDLVRYRRGDITTLYNVYFYNDASIMRPESTYELQSLLSMLSENLNYRIRLHGHTNGNFFGKIKSHVAGGNLFSVDENTTTSLGSAKTLSHKRAEIIKDYLIQKGIDPNRIEIKAWGGKRPLYDKHSVNAHKNVRVEAEVLND